MSDFLQAGQITEATQALGRLRANMRMTIKGKDEVVEHVLVCLVAGGHLLIEDLPGVGKTTLAYSLARSMDCVFSRVQFTSDLLPSDVTGVAIYDETIKEFVFKKGPVFANVVLADEINRATPKTQSALLEVMDRAKVTVDGEAHAVGSPFMVFATQNPVDYEGTFPLPEAQLDRFIFNILVDYPTAAEEVQIIKQVTGTYKAELVPLVNAQQVVQLQEIVRRVPVADHVVEYAATLARATRPKQPEAPDFVKEMVGWGAGPRAGIYLVTAAKARALLHGRFHATTADVTAVALPVLRHRVLTTFNAEAAGVTSDQIVRMLLDHLQPKSDLVL
jgi:MoxR-like ATPase